MPLLSVRVCRLREASVRFPAWRVAEDPFRVFIRTPEAEAIAAGVDDLTPAAAAWRGVANGVSRRSASRAMTACSSASAGRPVSCRAPKDRTGYDGIAAMSPPRRRAADIRRRTRKRAAPEDAAPVDWSDVVNPRN